MFLRSQFFVYKIYFGLLDRLHILTVSWNLEKECFEMKKSLLSKQISYTTICSNWIYFIAASYIFLMLKVSGTETSTISITLHFLALTGTCYTFLWGSLYVIKASELVCIMNKILLLEKLHFHSKQLLIQLTMPSD